MSNETQKISKNVKRRREQFSNMTTEMRNF